MANEAVQKALADAKERQAETKRQYEERQAGKPTPTQEENDRSKLGEHVVEKEDDGSPKEEDLVKRRSLESKPSSGQYATRTTRASGPSGSST
jgi:hypothetical protein